MGLGHGFRSLNLFTFSGQFVLPALPREYGGFDLHSEGSEVSSLRAVGVGTTIQFGASSKAGEGKERSRAAWIQVLGGLPHSPVALDDDPKPLVKMS